MTLDLAKLLEKIEMSIGQSSQEGNVYRALPRVENYVKELAIDVGKILVKGTRQDPPYTPWEIEATARALVWKAWVDWMWTSKSEREKSPDHRAREIRPIVEQLFGKFTAGAIEIGKGGGRPEGRSLLIQLENY